MVAELMQSLHGNDIIEVAQIFTSMQLANLLI